MPASFSSRTAAVIAAIGSLLVAGPAGAQSAPPAPMPAPQPYPGAWGPYAAPPEGYAAPAWGSGTPVIVERKSPGMMAGGIALISIGTVGSIIGAALLASGTSGNDIDWTCPTDFECFPTVKSRGGLVAAGGTMVAISTASLIVGIPLLAVGMRKVRAHAEAAAIVPEVRLGVTGGSLRWQF